MILEIPSGRLATYGCIARIAVHRFGPHGSFTARRVAEFRRTLYEILGHETQVPLHRIAKQGDLTSQADSPETGYENNRRRQREGTPRDSAAWWCSEEGR